VTAGEFEKAASSGRTNNVTSKTALRSGSSQHGKARRASVASIWVVAMVRVTPASSVFIIVPVALVAAGSGSFLAFVFAAIVGVFMAFCWAELSAAFPIAAGFALVGPLAAIGLYELSRRREAGLDSSTGHALDVLHSPSLGAIIALGVLLMALFLIWLVVAEALYIAVFGYSPPTSITQFAHDVLTTPRGWTLIVVGTGIGFLFAALVLSISAISFPLLLDRDVGAAVAVHTSLRVIAANPLPMALWGLIVAALLVIGSIPFFVGLTVVMPVLGHATWHLYRRTVIPDRNAHWDYQPRERPRRSAADFPAALLPTHWWGKSDIGENG